MFKKILIANRGEIACRIIRTCRRMGIKTVAIYSDIDATSQHVQQADESYVLGGKTPSESYLNAQKIIEIACQARVDAIHPGYGFLSENADFAQAVEEAGIVFIGPKPEIIRQMGDKIVAKQLAKAAEVPLIPGTPQAINHTDEVMRFANTHGYPILLKAAAGGGGKGMRVVYEEAEIAQSLTRAISEATTSFKDGRVFVEKYIEHPRHIEIQILGDKHGKVIHLGERDCSLQRRHQKVIEETPSPFIGEDVRQKMIQSAVSLAQSVGYDSAGTVEFVVSLDQSYYFLEMNTRLQVEHPITELTTGIDLVEEMIKIAAGYPLSYCQEEIQFSGHAIEARIYAEDPEQNFIPSSGRLFRCSFPKKEDIRLDSGVVEGDVVSIYYDPMLAKISAHGKNREEAQKRLMHALASTVVDGLDHNILFLQRLLSNSAVLDGQYHTQTISQLIEKKEDINQLDEHRQKIFKAMSVAVHHQFMPLLGNFPQEIIIVINDTIHKVMVQQPDHILIESEEYAISLQWLNSRRVFSCQVLSIEQQIPKTFVQDDYAQEQVIGQVIRHSSWITIRLFGYTADVMVMRPHIWDLFQHLPKRSKNTDLNTLRSPMPGVLIALPIAVGDHVKKGQTLAVIEAMKMENALTASAEGVVTDIFVKHGDSLSRDQVIAKFG